MAKPLALREYQQYGIELFKRLEHPPRHLFTWDMGAGKTIGAFSVVHRYGHKKVLIVCPAIVRGTWLSEIKKHWPDVAARAIVWGRKVKLPKAKSAERDEAFAADVQVVSYDLVGQVDPFGWDFIIVDEFHNLRNPASKQSKTLRALFSANPDAWAVGLSGTPIPNEAQQIWNPVNTFFPQMWNGFSKTFRIPWKFLSRFCEKETNEYGTRFFGLKEANREQLEEELRKVSFRVTQADFAKYLPPLFVSPLHIETATDPVKVALEWYESVKDECPHVGIYTHLRQTAADIAAAIPDARLITGSVTPAARDIALAELRESSSSVLVGTTHALKEGISLSFQKAALVVEWTTAVDEVTQFIARFARQDSTCQMPTRVQFVVGPTDHGRAETLSSRIENIQHLVKPSRADGLAAEVFAPVEMSDESFQSELSRLIASTEKRAQLWSAGEDDDDDDE